MVASGEIKGRATTRQSSNNLPAYPGFLYSTSIRGLYLIAGMNDAFNLERRRNAHWCLAVVLVAICALTVSVATRYCSVHAAVSSKVTVQKRLLPERSRQRLLKNPLAWQPLLVASAMVWEPAFYAGLVPSRPAIATFLFDPCLYNRPPPSTQTLS